MQSVIGTTIEIISSLSAMEQNIQINTCSNTKGKELEQEKK